AKLLVADALDFAFGLFAAGDGDNLLENLRTDALDRRAVEDLAGIDVHVVGHPLVQRRVRGDFDRRSRFAAVTASPAGGEHDDVRAAGDDAGDRSRVEAGSVHDDKTALGDWLAVLVDGPERGRAGFCDRAEGLFVDGRQAAALVADGGVVIDR